MCSLLLAEATELADVDFSVVVLQTGDEDKPDKFPSPRAWVSTESTPHVGRVRPFLPGAPAVSGTCLEIIPSPCTCNFACHCP